MVRTHSERGSEVLEAAIVLPMLIVLAFCLIQVCLIAYEGTAMSAAIESATMKSDFSAAIASGNVNQAVKDELASNTPGIVKSSLKGYFATYSLGDFNIPIGSHVTAHAVPYTAGKAWRPADSGNGKYSFKAGSDTPEYEEYTSTKELPQEVIDEMKTAVNQATNNK